MTLQLHPFTSCYVGQAIIFGEDMLINKHQHFFKRQKLNYVKIIETNYSKKKKQLLMNDTCSERKKKEVQSNEYSFDEYALWRNECRHPFYQYMSDSVIFFSFFSIFFLNGIRFSSAIFLKLNFPFKFNLTIILSNSVIVSFSLNGKTWLDRWK